MFDKPHINTAGFCDKLQLTTVIVRDTQPHRPIDNSLTKNQPGAQKITTLTPSDCTTQSERGTHDDDGRKTKCLHDTRARAAGVTASGCVLLSPHG